MLFEDFDDHKKIVLVVYDKGRLFAFDMLGYLHGCIHELAQSIVEVFTKRVNILHITLLRVNYKVTVVGPRFP